MNLRYTVCFIYSRTPFLEDPSPLFYKSQSQISSLKSAIYDKARSEKVRNPKKKTRGRRDADSDDDDSTDDEAGAMTEDESLLSMLRDDDDLQEDPEGGLSSLWPE